MKYTFGLWAVVNTVHDGDTLYADVDQGMGTWNKGLSKNGVGLRIYGMNAIELKDPGGKEAQAYLAKLIPVGSRIEIQCLAWDKWNGRIDVSIDLPKIGDLATHLIAQQWGAPYLGVGEKVTPPWPRTVKK